jgi:putative glutathione S-transferase
MQHATAEARQGRFVRQPNAFTDRITADGSSGFPAEPGRYHLYVSYACPWAHRTLIVRALKGLEDVVSVGVVDPIRDERGWQFTGPDVPPAEGPQRGQFRDEVNGFGYLSEAYLATDPAYDRRVTVPCVWDRVTGRLVSNDFPQIPRQLATEFDAHATHPEVDLYPVQLRDAIDALDEIVYDTVNNGVYKAGFATDADAYAEAYAALFATLGDLDARLADHRYLLGEAITLIDVHLYVTLVRFDAVYYSHFKCNRQRISDYPHLSGYLRDLYQTPGFGSTTDLDHIKRHYFGTHERLNPSRIVPLGPEIDLTAPHGRG